MKRLEYTLLVGLAGLAFGAMARADDAPAEKDEPKADGAAEETESTAFGATVRPFLARYCVSCHGAEKPKAGLDLSGYRAAKDVLAARKVWERVVDYVSTGEMPPQGRRNPRPADAEAEAVVAWVEGQLSKSACALDNPGRVTLRRLNRAEYNNTIRDLVGVDFRPADDFPADDVGYGFDNIGDVLSLPPILFEKYLAAAEAIADKAIVVPEVPVKRFEAKALQGGAPHGAGGSGRILPSTADLTVSYPAARDGLHIVRVEAFGDQAGREPVRAAVKVDGQVVGEFAVPAKAEEPGLYEVKLPLKAGDRRLAVAFLNDYYQPEAADPKDRGDRNLIVRSVEVQGPPAPLSGDLPASHKRLITRTPEGDNWRDAARAILDRFLARAYRRPARNDEVGRLVGLVEMAHKDGEPFERGIQLAVQAALVSPHFLFRVEVDRRPPMPKKFGSAASEGATRSLNDFELASRLSYFLWSSLPDDELFDLARKGQLQKDDVLEAQARRMLKDPRSRALVENFAGQWLQLRNLKAVNPDPARFPAFDEALRAAMLGETEGFFETVMREDRSILEFLDADWTVLNGRLAKHYGISGVEGDAFRKVALPDGRRGGIITQASVLTVTSNPTRTSPVKRGKYILDQVLGTPPPPPPPDVPELKDEGVDLSASLRVRMEQHRANPNCASCHNRMDPLGFGLENFDAVGAWRDRDGKFAVDASGELPGGVKFDGPKELKAILGERAKDFERCLAEKLLTYAIGRGVESSDACAVDKIVEAVQGDGHKFSRLAVEIVKSDPFRKRRREEVELK